MRIITHSKCGTRHHRLPLFPPDPLRHFPSMATSSLAQCLHVKERRNHKTAIHQWKTQRTRIKQYCTSVFFIIMLFFGVSPHCKFAVVRFFWLISWKQAENYNKRAWWWIESTVHSTVQQSTSQKCGWLTKCDRLPSAIRISPEKVLHLSENMSNILDSRPGFCPIWTRFSISSEKSGNSI